MSPDHSTMPGPHRLTSALSPQALLAHITASYRIVRETVDLGNASVAIVRVADPDALVDAIDPASFAKDERLPYWSDLWTSSIALARWCRTTPWLKGKTFLELGCGVGLAGLAAAREGARVTMTDYEPDALAFASLNVRENLPEPLPDIRLLDWRDPHDPGTFDVIAGADIIYERSDFFHLLKLFASALNPGGVVMLTDPGRSVGGDFLRTAGNSGFVLENHLLPVERRGQTVAVTCALLRQAVPAAGREL
jgi:2-polyprenyl-3-methyl-5-hydroxy-6-metoxy-1,4-benzoquinol methylase